MTTLSLLDPPLAPQEVRVLGCLMEKEVTTPDGYPLTVNSLLAACNQTTNRHPVVRYEELDVTNALSSLRERGLTRVVYSPSNRAPKHRHIAREALSLADDEFAVLTVLLLRGPQTLGELKGRTERMHAFPELAAVERALDRLAARERPLAVRLPRAPGHKDARYAHLLAGEPAAVDEDAPAGPSRPERADRLGALEHRVSQLEQDLARVREVVDRLKDLL